MPDRLQSGAAGLDVGGGDLDQEVVFDGVHDGEGVGVGLVAHTLLVVFPGHELVEVQTLLVDGEGLGVDDSDDDGLLPVLILEEVAAPLDDLRESLADGSESRKEDPHLRAP